jgi:hypothetical protein
VNTAIIILSPITVGTFFDQMRDCQLLNNKYSNEDSLYLNIMEYVGQQRGLLMI